MVCHQMISPLNFIKTGNKLAWQAIEEYDPLISLKHKK